MKQVPNCRICKWTESGTTPEESERKICSAQGFLFCYQVYNTKACRSLFTMRIKDDNRKETVKPEK